MDQMGTPTCSWMMQAALWEVEVVRGQSLTWDARSARDGNGFGFVQGSFTPALPLPRSAGRRRQHHLSIQHSFNHPARSATSARRAQGVYSNKHSRLRNVDVPTCMGGTLDKK